MIQVSKKYCTSSLAQKLRSVRINVQIISCLVFSKKKNNKIKNQIQSVFIYKRNKMLRNEY